MTRRRTDRNHAEIVNALRKLQCSVADTSGAGCGFPDLVVGVRGHNLLIEVKDGRKKPSARKLTPAQIQFHATWRGNIHIVESVDQAIELIRRHP